MSECEIRELTHQELDMVAGGHGGIDISVGILNVLSNNNGNETGISQSAGFIVVNKVSKHTFVL